MMQTHSTRILPPSLCVKLLLLQPGNELGATGGAGVACALVHASTSRQSATPSAKPLAISRMRRLVRRVRRMGHTSMRSV